MLAYRPKLWCQPSIHHHNLLRAPIVGRVRLHRCHSATGPGSAFDESPDEPVSEQTQQLSNELMTSMKQKIMAALETEDVVVEDIYGNYQHVNIEVISPLFEDKTSVQRQRMVYKVRVTLENVAAADSSGCSLM
jgi:stress-induced morphogen